MVHVDTNMLQNLHGCRAKKKESRINVSSKIKRRARIG